MPEVKNYSFSHVELTEILVKKLDLHAFDLLVGVQHFVSYSHG